MGGEKVTKTLEIKIDTKEAVNKISEVEDKMRKLNDYYHEIGIDQKQIESISEVGAKYRDIVQQQEKYNELKKNELELQKLLKYAKDEDKENLKKTIEESKSRRKSMLKSGDVKDPEAEKKEKEIKDKTWKNIKKGLKSFEKDALQVWNTLGINLKSVFGDVVKELGAMLDPYKGMASYGLGTSLFTNAAAREQAMKYGLSDSQNYALTQTMSMLGMNNDNDLMYMNSAQKQKFNRLMDQYNNWYTQMESSGLLQNVQEAQLEFKMLKQEIAYKLLDWFAQHKDQIMTALQVIMKAVEVIANVIISILNWLPGTKYSSGVDASLVSTTGINNYVNVNNTNNGTALLNNKEELQASFDNSNQNLVKQIGASLLSRR